MGSGTREWDAGTYDRVATPQLEWARGVIERLPLNGDEIVLDAGCGSGRVTELLIERVPSGSVIAVDGSAEMLREAERRLGDRAKLVQSDLLDLELERPVDAIFSNAVFHWIHDHGLLFRRLAATLIPGGRLVAQCGGEGNIADFAAAAGRIGASEPYRAHLAGFHPNHFASPQATAALLEAAGFEEVSCWLEPRPVRPPEPREFIRTVCLGSHLDRLPEQLREPYMSAVVAELGPDPELGYVRLNISARRAA